MAAQFLIYALSDPRTGEPRYVGRSSSGLRRPGQHSSPAFFKRETNHKANWIKSLAALGLRPVVEVIEEMSDQTALDEAETYWIVQLSALGFRLTNLTTGGEGNIGWKQTDEAKAKISASMRGNKNTVGRKLSVETRARISAAMKGRPSPLRGRKKSNGRS